MNKMKLIALLGLCFVGSSYANPFSVDGKEQFVAKFYKVEYKNDLVSKNGVYNNGSPFLKVNGVLTSEINKEVNKSAAKNDFQITGGSFAFIDSMQVVKKSDIDTDSDPDIDISPGVYEEGSWVNYAKKGGEIYDFDIGKRYFMKEQEHSKESEKAIDEIFKYADEIKLKKPLVHNDSVILNNIYLPLGKTLRHDFPPYSDKGKMYQQVVLVSFN